MSRGDKSKYTDKQKRQAEHIEEGYESRGLNEKEAARRAWATVNKMEHGGKKSGSGRGKTVNKCPPKKVASWEAPLPPPGPRKNARPVPRKPPKLASVAPRKVSDLVAAATKNRTQISQPAGPSSPGGRVWSSAAASLRAYARARWRCKLLKRYDPGIKLSLVAKRQVRPGVS